MPADQAIVVLHGITMSGASMLRTLGPLRGRLEALGFDLIAPNAGHRMSAEELAALRAMVVDRYTKVGQNADESFRDGAFWRAGEHYDWFRPTTDAASGKKTYQALEQSFDAIAAALRNRRAVGVLGFSQGAAMAILLAARALQGDNRFRGLGWGVFLSGFKPVFDRPEAVTYPIAGRFPALFVIGAKDPVLPGGASHLASMSDAFEDPSRELIVIPDLGHDVPADPRDIERIVKFVAAR